MTTPVTEPQHLDYECLECGASHGGQHVCCAAHEEELPPPPPTRPFVKRWDPAGYWVHCMVERGLAWDPKLQRYTAVQPNEGVSAIFIGTLLP